MSRVHYFQRYSQKENVVTNNTLLLFSRLYNHSPTRFEDFLNALSGDGNLTFDVGMQFAQQEGNTKRNSVPDGLITQKSIKVVIETKLHGNYGLSQLSNHLESFQNEDTQGDGYIFRSVDDWSGLPSNTIVKSVPLAHILGSRFGDGEILVEGQGRVDDPLIVYSYRYDPCFNPQSDPSCEGYVPEIPEVPTVEDPLSADYLQDEIDRKAVMANEEEERQDRERVKEDDSDIDEESLEELLGIAMESALAASDNVVADQLSSMNVLPSSYMTALPSTTYNETITLSDNGAIIKSLVPTNRTRRMSFAQDKLHNELVQSQFKR